MNTARWYVARTHPGQEATALTHLQRQGFVAFNPRTTESVVIAGRERRVTMALFPSYIFVEFDISEPAQRWRSVNGTRGIVRLLPQHLETPMPVPDGFVPALQARIEAGEFTRNDGRAMLLGYARGDVVPIRDGTLQGLSGTFDAQVAGTVYLLMQIMGRPQRVGVPVDCVAAL